jgi:hypothetical protein
MSPVTAITLVMAYYENPGMLQRHYDAWREMDPKLREHVHVIIVDDGSPNGPATPPRNLIMRLQIYRMTKDIRWNQDACRNVGVAHAETEWVLLTDIDHEVREETWRYLVYREWNPRVAYKFRRISAPDFDYYKAHPNSWFMTRKLYDAAGGYDERFAGYYGTDGDFRDRVLSKAEEVITLKQSIVRVPRQVVPDASTTTYLRKQPEDRIGISRVFEERVKLQEAAEQGGDPWTPLRGSQEYLRVHVQ